MPNKVVSIELGANTIKICEIDYKKKTPRVYHMRSFKTPAGIMDDGNIHDKRALAKILKEQMDKEGIKINKVVFTISSTKIASREAMIPYVKENRIKDIVMANASDYFPIDVDEYNITYQVLEKINTKEERQIRLLVLAAPSDLIKKYYELADMMHLDIVAIDYIGNSVFQLVKNQGREGVNLVVQINDENTIINLMENDILLLQRTLSYGSNNIIQAVLSNKVLGASDEEEALELLENECIIQPQFAPMQPDYDAFDKESEEYNKRRLKQNAMEDVTMALKGLISSINRVMDYFITKHAGKKITGILLTGDMVYVKGMDQLIFHEIGITTSRLEKIDHITFGKNAEPLVNKQSWFLSCIGAAASPLNFAPKELTEKVQNANSMMFPVIILGVSIIGACVIYLSSFLLYHHSLGEKEDLEEKIASISDIEEVYTAYNQSSTKLNNVEAMQEQTENVSEDLLAFLEELEQKTPKGCVVNSFDLSAGELSMQVTATDKTLCAKYVETLKSMDTISSVSTLGYTNADSNEGEKVNFTVVCTFSQGEE